MAESPSSGRDAKRIPDATVARLPIYLRSLLELSAGTLTVSSEQLAHEWLHLQQKLAIRSPSLLAQWEDLAKPACHPLFRRRPGPVASWERASGGA